MSAAETLAALVHETPPKDLPVLAGELARALATVIARTAAATVAAPVTAPVRPADELLTVEEAAARLHVEVSWLYRHARDLPFTRKLGHRTLRFEARGLERWAANRPRT
jgi:predicted DNA-binding transcriptional regulator AlpA